MFHPKVPPRFNTYSIAGKVFILGEYAVLAGLPALVAALPPRFKMRVGAGEPVSKALNSVVHGPGASGIGYSVTHFHEESPLGKLQAWAKKMGLPELCFDFEDPFRGSGGFGASTAQFAMGYRAYADRFENLPQGPKQVWNFYRELMGSGPSGGISKMGPSGADLVAQWEGGVIVFRLGNVAEGLDIVEEDPLHFVWNVWPNLDWSNLLVFSATHQEGRKVPTHHHLDALAEKGFPRSDHALVAKLETGVRQGLAAVQTGSLAQLGKAMDDYAEILNQAGLEVEATTLDRKKLRELPGVLGVKGTGALQSDGILVLVEPDAARTEGARSEERRSAEGRPAEGIKDRRIQVIQAAKNLGLNLVSDGLTYQMGVECLKSE